MIDMPPGWVPNNDASVDPHLECDLKEIKEHPPTQQEYMPKIVEKLKECYDPEISVDIYNLGLIYETGRGVERDIERAVRLYKAATQDVRYSLPQFLVAIS